MRFPAKNDVPAVEMSGEELCKSWQSHCQHMDVPCWLKEIGLYRKHMVRDANSLFRAVSDVVYSTQRYYRIVRKRCCQQLVKNQHFRLKLETSVEEYAKAMSHDTTYGTLNELTVLSHHYKYDFIVIDARNGPNLNFVNGYDTRAYLLFQQNMQHFDLLLPVAYMKTSAFCQSIMYNILYEGVFKMTDVEFASSCMLSDKTSEDIDNVDYGKNNQLTDTKNANNTINDNGTISDKSVCKWTSNSSIIFNTTNAKELLKNNIMPFPNKVARGLSPYIYKNVDFDAWFEIKKEKDVHYNDGIKLQVGVKCLCKVQIDQGAPFICYIQTMKPDGACMVYVEELGEKKIVQIDQLYPLPTNEAKPWYSFKKAKNGKKVSPKRKKSYYEEFDCSKTVLNTKNKPFFKSRVINNTVINDNDVKDPNNNSVYSEGDSNFLTSPCSIIEHNEKYGTNGYNFMKKYTKIDHASFVPYSVDLIAMPFTVEQNSNTSTVCQNRESPAQSRTPVSNSFTNVSTTNASQYPATTTVVTTNTDTQPPLQYSNSPPTPSTLTVPSSNNSYSAPYQPMPIYYVQPSVFPNVRQTGQINMGFPFPRSPLLPVGVNLGVQRSMNQNGSDLPYNDIPTLRYFFNLGIEWMQLNSANWGPPPYSFPPPPSYYIQPTTTPNQLALDMQQSLSLQDNSNNAPYGVQDNKNYNNNPNYHKVSNGKYDYKNNKGPHNTRYRRNDFSSDRNNSNKNMTNFNRTNGAYNNKKSNNRNVAYNDTSGDKKDNQESEVNSPSTTPNFPIITYPPPPMYRMPYCSMESSEGQVVSSGYTPNYTPYMNSPDDGSSQLMMENYLPPPGSMPHPHYMTYLTPPPPMYYPPIPNQYNQSQSQNDSPAK